MPLYEVVWREAHGEVFEGEWDAPMLVQAGIQALSELPDGSDMISVQLADYARELEDERLAEV